jgi:hypothetical protein
VVLRGAAQRARRDRARRRVGGTAVNRAPHGQRDRQPTRLQHPEALACLRLRANKLLKQTLSFNSPFGTNLLTRQCATVRPIPPDADALGHNRDDARSYVSAFSGGEIDAADYRRLLSQPGRDRPPARLSGTYVRLGVG